MDDHQSEPRREGEGNRDRVRITFELTEQQAELLEAAIARGEFKAFGIVKAGRISPEETVALPEDQLQTLEQLRRGKPKNRDV